MNWEEKLVLLNMYKHEVLNSHHVKTVDNLESFLYLFTLSLL